LTKDDKMKINALFVHSIIEYAQVRGIDKGLLINKITQPPKDWNSDTATVLLEDFYKVLSLIQASLSENGLGIRMGNFFNLQALGLVYQISLQSSSIAEALHYLKNFMDVAFPFLNLTIEVTDKEAKIFISIDNQLVKENAIVLESIITIISRELSLMAVADLRIIKTSPNVTQNYPLDWQFGNLYSLKFIPNILKATLQDKTKHQLEFLVPAFMKLIKAYKADETFGTKTKLMVLHLAKPELPDLETVADAFYLTPRTLQRRLSSENQTFRFIIDELRREISLNLIRHNCFSITDITYILGYSEPAAFIHSFKKWFGDSPQKFRNIVNLLPT
jgi:AraC-like DNA-binding protein